MKNMSTEIYVLEFFFRLHSSFLKANDIAFKGSFFKHFVPSTNIYHKNGILYKRFLGNGKM